MNFDTEKELQTLVEKNLKTVFNSRFVATEFSTGEHHAGRIDTLALSEDNNPVIIEYKKVEASDLVNQSLFYLSWITDHRGDFELAVRKQLGEKTPVDWSDVRVICIAPNYRKYDLHAVQMMKVRAAESTNDAKALKRTRWSLLKSPWNLNADESAKLADLQRTNRRIFRAYLLKEGLADILRRRHAPRRSRTIARPTDVAPIGTSMRLTPASGARSNSAFSTRMRCAGKGPA